MRIGAILELSQQRRNTNTRDAVAKWPDRTNEWWEKIRRGLSAPEIARAFVRDVFPRRTHDQHATAPKFMHPPRLYRGCTQNKSPWLHSSSARVVRIMTPTGADVSAPYRAALAVDPLIAVWRSSAPGSSNRDLLSRPGTVAAWADAGSPTSVAPTRALRGCRADVRQAEL